MSDRPTLFVMAKTPRLGVGKTRLARGMGRAAALRVNRFLQARTMRMLAGDPRWRLLLLVSPDRDIHACAPGVWPRTISRAGQGRGDLGARLARAFARLGRRPAAVIGVDCPDQDRRRVATAFRAGRRFGAALGPTLDGGFWILAVRHARAAAPAFAHVRWSTPHACADMARALGGAAYVDTLQDVDEVEDWRAFLQRAATRAGRSSGR